MRKNYYSLIEMLVVMAIIAMMFELVFQFLYDGSKLCTNAIDKTFSNQEILILSGRFRNVIHKSSDWEKNENCLVSGSKKIVAENNRIFLLDGNNESVLALLPQYMKISLDIENKEKSANLAVLIIEVRGKQKVKDKIRIVSCI